MQIAEEFSSKIPSGKFSPAELQGFLLKHKKAARKALSEVELWVRDTMGKKAAPLRGIADVGLAGAANIEEESGNFGSG